MLQKVGTGFCPKGGRVAGVYTPALLAPPEVGKSVATTMRISVVITEKGNIANGATLLKIAYGSRHNLHLKLLLYLSPKSPHRGKLGATVGGYTSSRTVKLVHL